MFKLKDKTKFTFLRSFQKLIDWPIQSFITIGLDKQKNSA